MGTLSGGGALQTAYNPMLLLELAVEGLEPRHFPELFNKGVRQIDGFDAAIDLSEGACLMF